MKYLINAEKKVLRKGEFVKADEPAGEFIFLDNDAAADGITVDDIKTMCEANGIRYSKNANKADLFANLISNLPKLNVPEQNKMSQSDIIKSIVTEAGQNRKPGTDPDQFEVEVFTECIQRLNSEGITFKIKQLGNLVKKEIAEQGLIITTAQRKEQVNAILTEADFNPSNWDEVEEMIERLTREVGDTDRKQALGSIRRYLKANELELPKRAKAAKVGFRQKVINFMVANSPVTDDALKAFIVGEGKEAEEADKVVGRLASLRETINAAFAAGAASAGGAVEEEAA